jgi:hypothetical protein
VCSFPGQPLHIWVLGLPPGNEGEVLWKKVGVYEVSCWQEVQNPEGVM